MRNGGVNRNNQIQIGDVRRRIRHIFYFRGQLYNCLLTLGQSEVASIQL
jgi:hypothetical protein